jgi:beta-lactamase regulating signal transducer with metallopeptidase domain
MPDIPLVVLSVACDAAVKFAVLVLIADVFTRGLNRTAPVAVNRLWIAVLATGTLLPLVGSMTPATVLIQPSAVVLDRIPVGIRSASSATIACVAIAAVALFLLTRLATGLVSIRRLIASSCEIPGAEGDSLRRMGGVRTRRAMACRVASHSSLLVPVTVGHWTPWILLPDDWRIWPAARLSAVMAHEGAHVERGDYLVGIWAALFRAVWWWHPAAWLAVSRVHLTAEFACDARASAVEGRADYAGHLLELAQTAAGRRVRYGWTLGATSRLRERVDALIDEQTATRPLAIALRTIIVAVAIVLACAAAPIRFTFSGAPDVAPGVAFDHGAAHAVVHGLRHGRH